MEQQQPQYENELPTDEAVAAEREQPSGYAPEHGADGARAGRFTGDIVTAAEGAGRAWAASGSEGQGEADPEQDVAMSPPGYSDLEPDGEAEIKARTSALESDRRLLANVYPDPQRHTVALLLDDVTANMVMYAVRVLAADSEAHAREVRLVGATLPPDSYGAANRHAIASRHERIALRLRALETSYHHEITTAKDSLTRVHR